MLSLNLCRFKRSGYNGVSSLITLVSRSISESQNHLGKADAYKFDITLENEFN